MVRHFVPVANVRTDWDRVAAEIGLPRGDGEAGLTLIRLSMAQILRERRVPDDQTEMQLGHPPISRTP